MEQNYFNKKIKNILDNPPNFEPDAGALADMNRRLDGLGQQQQSQQPNALWLLPLLLLPFLFGTIFFYQKYQEVSTQLFNLNEKVALLEKDNLTKKVITYQYDTIYKVIHQDIYREKIIETVSSNPNARTISLSDWTGSGSRFGQNDRLNFSRLEESWPFYDPKDRMNRSWINTASKDDLTKEQTLNASIPTGTLIAYLALGSLNSPLKESDLSPKLNDLGYIGVDLKPKAAYYLLPKNLNISAYYVPTLGGKVFSSGLSGNGFGINGGIEFLGGLEMKIGIERIKTNFEIKDPANFGNFPLLPPDNSGDLLAEVKVNTSFLQIPIGMQKSFRSNKDLQPFIGIGFAAQRPLKHSFIYEYVNNNVGEYKLEQSFSTGSFSVDNIRANIGFQYQINPYFALTSSALYHHSFSESKEEYFKLRYWRWQIGFRFNPFGKDR